MSAKITENDRKIMATAWLCMKTEPQIDYALLAQHMGWKNARVASVCFGPVKKKFVASIGQGGATQGTPKKGEGNKGKRVIEEVEAEEDDDEEIMEPKVKKGRKVKGDEVEGGEDGDGDGKREKGVEVKAEGGEGQ
nr:hypothetical protein B0A51_16912 [Rachicladosporium sp. CCFEE 5018]